MIIITDTYSQPDAPDPVLAEDRVLELARRHAGSARKVTFIDESGGEARAYMCDDGLVLKTQRPQQLRPRTSLEKEAFILGQLAAQNDLRVPRVIGCGREDAEYLLMTRIPGVSLESTSSLPGPARIAVLRELGATLRWIHNTDQSAMETSALIPGDGSAAGLRNRLSAMFGHLVSALSADQRWAAAIDLRAVAGQALAELPASTPPATLHSNPGPEHCFIDPGSGRCRGLIDFGDAYRSTRSWTCGPGDPRMTAATCSPGTRPPDRSRTASSMSGAPALS